MTEKDHPPDDVSGSAAKRSKRGAGPRRESSKTFTVEKLRPRLAARIQAPVAADPGSAETKTLDASVSSLSEAEHVSRLNALAKARMREPDERREADEKARAEAERETALRVARLEKELAAVSAVRQLERNRSAEFARKIEEGERSRKHLEDEIADLTTKLTSAHEQLRENAAALERERDNSSHLKAALSTRTVEAWRDTAKRDEMATRLEEAERELAAYRARPWWRRLAE